MAKGDIVNGVTSSGTSVDFQPASGVEIKILSFGISITGGHTPAVYLYDGTNSVKIGVNGNYSEHLNQGPIITNSLYLRFTNTSPSKSWYSGVVINV